MIGHFKLSIGQWLMVMFNTEVQCTSWHFILQQHAGNQLYQDTPFCILLTICWEKLMRKSQMQYWVLWLAPQLSSIKSNWSLTAIWRQRSMYISDILFYMGMPEVICAGAHLSEACHFLLSKAKEEVLDVRSCNMHQLSTVKLRE